jgi:hypothetical protein
MSLFDEVGGLIRQYAAGRAASAANLGEHFDQVSQAVPSSSMAAGLAAALGSSGSASFGQMASQLFASSGSTQQAGLVNTLLATAGPEVLQRFLGANAGSALEGLLAGGQAQVSPEQAASVPPEEVQALAQHVHSNSPSIADSVGEIYGEHPTLIKTLGAVAMTMALRNIAERHSA